ncbi:glycoside hydrolase family 99-like domain-containing protein [Anaerovibrio sp. RM50]|uniref:glycosyltransferase WbsX family protein n=1 Tax=Anaerovibrio sp. RM50 TaxID=1200557 RepID=UPI0004825498|nr:glycoside hydrolase family 99-like domain-containing protein [Anaerovibrio sp. RM50]
MKPSILAIYLPQYHQTEYNDKWWGEGYTEWTACKHAKPLFKGHVQPRIPYSEYDLSHVNAISRQAKMAKEHGIDGFVIYHYYSCGSKLLDKPTELLLNNEDIDTNYCLYWANESWESRWYGQKTEVIWEQKYGNENNWEEHFHYCLKFFKDKRYIKVDNKPVFIIYKDWSFKDVNKFVTYWNELAIKNGFDGIYFVKTVAGGNDDSLGCFNAAFEREPFYTFTHGLPAFRKYGRYLRSRVLEYLNKIILNKFKTGVIQYQPDYKEICNLISSRNMPNGGRTILGAFTDWDNSPRRQYNSTVFRNVSVDAFEKCLRNQYYKAEEQESPFVIINAWNEWGEGNYLEPDELYSDGFLKAVKNVKS